MERNVPKLRFKGFNDEWKEEFISTICSLSSGSTPSKAKKEYYNGTNLWVTSGELKNKYIYDTIDKITEKAIEDTNLKEYQKGSFLIAIYGLEAQGTRGSSAILGNNATISQACMALEPNKDLYNEFIYYWYAKYGNMIGIRYAQGTKQQNLSTDLVGNLKIKFPSLLEQERIANFLTKVDKIIEKQDEKVKNLEKYKKGMMQKIFSQEIRFKDENGEEYPKWEEKKLGDILIPGSKEKVKNTSDYQKITIKLNLKGIEKALITREMTDTRPFYVRRKGEIIIGKQNYFNGSIAIVSDEYDGCICSNAIMSFKVKYENNIFIYNYISQRNYLKRKEFFANGTGQKELSEKDFLNFDIYLPILSEQKKIAKVITKINMLIEAEIKKLELLKEYKKGLLQQMFI